ncbi:MAG: bifunctional hydroxymethylpyrimidine kinase/phosphomethylpyrimidine kinase [Aquificaceae bacterium]|nr:bifunctional hydroxymethylpyrimidine kinase/phosphomethylpyrimidine kinase [Aquificaceae bacterium]MDW8236812.1 bifunctional hydroxymethylpyrimidine kinase/phosphomethylpyrimidine kinase [Aquificaceae bacterium]
MKLSRALTIAGSDSSGGAGIQADLKTFSALGVYGMSAITCITAQNTTGVFNTHEVPPNVVYDQIKAVYEDIGVDALKTGMLYSAETIKAVVNAVLNLGLQNLVVDPVMRAKSGDSLLKDDAKSALIQELFPLALLVTPNIPEAEELSGMKIKTIEDMECACKLIHEKGCKAVIVKGGHLSSLDEAIDVFFDGQELHHFTSPFIDSKNTHGTGCTFSAAITAFLAMGQELKQAIKEAKHYTHGAIEHSIGIGSGHGPLNHFWHFYFNT